MLPKLRASRPGHATVAAYLALFVALGGSAYAAATIGSEQIIDDSVASIDIANRTLTLKDISAKALRDIRQLDVVVRHSPHITVGPNESRSTSADCRSGETAVGGGGSATPGAVLQDSAPIAFGGINSAPTRWTATFHRSATWGTSSALAFAVCVK